MSKLRWHLGQLDALRGIAALGVVAAHSVYLFPASHLTIPLFAGQRGVQLFFIVSSFTLFLSFENRRDEEHPTRNFFLRRFFRLAPLYYILLIFTRFTYPELSGSWSTTAICALFLQGLTPTLVVHGVQGGWTLACEAFSYALLPIAFRYIRSLTAAVKVFIATAVICGIGSFLLAHMYPSYHEFFEFLWFPCELPVFCLGVVCYWIKRELIHDENKPVSLLILAAVVLGGWAMLPFDDGGLYATSLLAGALLIAVLLHPWRMLVNPCTIFLGRISYSVYLLHGFALHLVAQPLLEMLIKHHVLSGRPIQGDLLRVVFTLIVTIPAATLTWWLIEESGIRVGRRLISRFEPAPVRKAATTIPLPAAAIGAQSNSPDAQF
jgi:peptidoglycan/LPS O-acetylase OafA/YrhL